MLFLIVSGVPRAVDITFCECEDMGVTLRRLGLWPATATEPRCAYSIRLLRWLEALMLSGHLSVHSFVEAVRFRNGQSQQEVSSLSIITIYLKYCAPSLITQS